jgi:hypothetical protein
MSVRWKDKTDIVTLAADDRMPVTDTSASNVDKYTTPAEIATFAGVALAATFQPLDSDLTAIAALTTTAYGRSLLTLASAAALAGEIDDVFVTGPASSTDNAITRFDGTTGKLVQNSGITVDDSNNLFFPTGTKIDWASGDVTITHSANALALAGASSGYSFDAAVRPSANDAAALGTAATAWADLFLASSGVLNWSNGAATILGSGASGGIEISADPGNAFASSDIKFLVDGTTRVVVGTAALRPETNDGTGLGTATVSWADLFLASGAVVNYANGNYTITHSSGDLAFSGTVTLTNTGLHLLDTNATHDLIIAPGSNLTADRTLTVTTGDTNIILDLTDAAADKLMFWDDSAGAWTALTLTAGLTISGTEIRATESFVIACSDETTNLSTGTAKVTFRMPYAFTLTNVRANVNTAPTGSTIIVDINDGGTTIMTTNKLSIDASEETSTTAATPPGITDTALADDAEITIDIDQVGSTIPGKGLKVTLIGYRP